MSNPVIYRHADDLSKLTRKEIYAKRAKRAVDALNKNNIPAVYADDRVEALKTLISMVPDGASIGTGDSETLVQIGFPEWLDAEDDAGREVNNPLQWLTRKEWVEPGPLGFRELTRKALVSDVFITGANAVTLDGMVVSVDDEGNRVAAMLHGPKKTILVIGGNKVVHNLDEAIRRCKDYATPGVALRHYIGHDLPFLEDYLPCQQAGYCPECKATNKACRKWVILDGQASLDFDGWNDYEKAPVLTHVIMVGEELGV